MRLRNFQQTASDCICNEWQEGKQSTMIVVPTGGGKTVIIADVIKRHHPQRALVIAHREELIWQARERIETYSGIQCEIEMADLTASANLFSKAQVVISTVQTQNAGYGDRRRMSRFKPTDFKLLIIDECHHATADTYRNVINYYQQNPEIKILGVTATPDRTDEEALGQVFKSCAFDYEILDAIHDGWLVPIDQQMVYVEGLDYSAIRTTAGDLNGGDLADVMEAERNLMAVAGASLQIIKDRRTIVFTSSVKQAESLCDIFNRHRPGISGWVSGKTPKEDRRELLKGFSDGRIQVVVNCGVLTEGFDNPGVEVIIMARPTKSRALYAQMAGRSTRPLAGVVDPFETADERKTAIQASPKPSCLIVDFVGNSGRHKLMTSADILGGKVSDTAIERAVALAKKLGTPVRMSQVLEDEEARIKREEEMAKVREAKRLDQLRKEGVKAKVMFNTRTVSPFDIMDITPVRARGWDNGKSLSEKQNALLLKQGINPSGMPYVQARQLIGELFNRWNKKQCTYKQAKVLLKYGYDGKCSMKEATAIIDRIAANGWRRPDPVVAAK